MSGPNLYRARALAGLLLWSFVSVLASAEDRCFSAKEVGASLLSRRIGAVHLRNVSPLEAARTLRAKYGVPVSFFEAEVAARVTVDLDDATVQDALAAIVAGAGGYEFGLVRDHLMLYSREPRYQLTLGPEDVSGLPRFEAANRAGTQIRGLKPLAGMSLPSIEGDARHPLHAESISWHGPASVLERLADVAGPDPAVVVSIERDRDGELAMSLGFVAQIESLEASVSKKDLTVGEQVQIGTGGIGRAGAKWDMTRASCGGGYTALSPRVAIVDENGLVTAVGAGRAFIGVHVQGLLRSVELRVMGPEGGKK
jgi:hypothetical protein